MRFLLSLFLPLVLCSDSSAPSSPTIDKAMKVKLNNSKITNIFLKPLNLKSRDDRHANLLSYGFIISTNDIVVPKKLTVKSQTLNIPKNAKALLLTLPKHQGKEFCQDIQITSYPYSDAQLPEFQKITLKKQHIPIYIQFADTPAQAPATFEHLPPAAKEEDDTDHQRSKKEKKDVQPDNQNIDYFAAARALLDKIDRPWWFHLCVAYFNATSTKGGRVQVISPLYQRANNTLEPNYFSIPLLKDDAFAFVLLPNKSILVITKNTSRHKITEVDIVRQSIDDPIEIKDSHHLNIRDPTREELKNIPEIKDNCWNIYFQIPKVEDYRFGRDY